MEWYISIKNKLIEYLMIWEELLNEKNVRMLWLYFGFKNKV